MSKLRQVGTFFRSNKGVFLICLSIATIIWLFNELSKSYTVNQELQIEYILPNEEIILQNKPPVILSTEVEAPGWDLLNRSLFNRTPKISPVITDARDQQIGSAALRDLAKQALGIDYTILDVYPSVINIKLDNQATKRIPLRVNANVFAAPQYKLQSQSFVVQDSITIIGSESVLKEITEWSTKLIDFPDVSANISGIVELEPALNSELKLKPAKVDFVIRVEQITEKEIRVPISVVTDFDSLLILPQEVRIIGNVSLQQFEAITADNFEAQVLINKSADTPLNRTAAIDIVQRPLGFENMRIIPEIIQYTILEPRDE